MDIIEPKLFEKMTDAVKTEETIYQQLVERMEDIRSDIVYVAVPLAWIINLKGIFAAQQYIDSFCQQYKDIDLFFICQHIKVNMLNFHSNVVFTPHATSLDPFYAIPHYSANVRNKELLSIKERKHFVSFQGAYHTHWTRTSLQTGLSGRKDCIVRDTGNWHFEKDKQTQHMISKQYTDLLNNTKVSACPRGTGPSTIRIWESMAHGCVPMIISDLLEMPMEYDIPWDELVIRVPEGDADKCLEYIPEEIELEEMSEKCKMYYDAWFSNNKLFKSVTNKLRELEETIEDV